MTYLRIQAGIVLCAMALAHSQAEAAMRDDPPVHHRAEANKLGNETSPYLLQHAFNPVDWYPWGEEAFAAARERNVPIFLSIGYSTCYWCHVMERESFENDAVAAIMNRDFVCIKVDREQRPDVDEIYMTACQVFTRLTTGRASGGWPLSVFLEPASLKPFVVGTYFPPQPGYGKPSFTQLLENIYAAWGNDREGITKQADQLAALITKELQGEGGVRPLPVSLVDAAVSNLVRFHDAVDGGFGGAPKFPQPSYLELMIAAGWGRADVEAAVRKTLDSMAIGGVYDHVGGGFHRYAVDKDWTVPHFEKMLYDNGQLASIYADVYARTDDPFYAEVVRGILNYVLREMTAEDGAFFSAQDAEVNAREGESYIWRPAEIRAALAEGDRLEDVDLVLDVYGLSKGANFRDPHHKETPPTNVLRFSDRPKTLAAAHGMTREEFLARMTKVNEALLAVRDTRDQPGLDDKVLTSWNGLMIKGMADGGRVLGEERYVDAAVRAANAVLARLSTSDGGLLRTSRGDAAQIDAFLEDYALLAEGLIAVYRATHDMAWLEKASGLVKAARMRFWNDVNGGWFDTQADQPDLFVRSTNLHDGAVPSGAGSMMLVLLDLYELAGDETVLSDLKRGFDGLSVGLVANPIGMARTTRALLRADQLGIDVASSATVAAPPTEPVRVAVLATNAVKGEYTVRLTIAPSMHINAHEPGDPLLVGLSILAAQGGSIEVEWPEGELYREEIRVHRSLIDVPVRITRDQPDSSVVLDVLWQACTDEACLRPSQKRITVPAP
jgi:uncharacterized protein YyaL (SSP411 family)